MGTIYKKFNSSDKKIVDLKDLFLKCVPNISLAVAILGLSISILGNDEGMISATDSTSNSGCHLVILSLSITMGGINLFKYSLEKLKISF